MARMVTWLKATRVYRSIFRVGLPRTEREQSAAMISSFVLHVQPAFVHRRTLRFATTLGLGLVALTLFALLCLTGVVLMFHYVPSVERAYASMQDLREVVSFGRVLRNSHRWAAHLMVIAAFVHMCRVFYTGAYKPPREFNWILGVGLLLLTLGLSFTGYLLPWDQLAFWAITVGSSIAGYVPVVGAQLKYTLLGGHIVGQGTLLRFYVLHVMVLPGVLGGLLAVHLWRVRKDGGLARSEETEATASESEPAAPDAKSARSYGLMMVVEGGEIPPTPPPEDMRSSWPHLLFREILVVMATICLVLAVSLIWDAPLEELANAVHPPNPAKAPWYFLGLQELVSHSALIGGVVVPSVLLLGLVLLPYIDPKPVGVGRWFDRRRTGVILVFTIVLIAVIALTIVGMYFRGPNWSWIVPWADVLIAPH